jgi:hypothetical protein
MRRANCRRRRTRCNTQTMVMAETLVKMRLQTPRTFRTARAMLIRKRCARVTGENGGKQWALRWWGRTWSDVRPTPSSPGDTHCEQQHRPSTCIVAITKQHTPQPTYFRLVSIWQCRNEVMSIRKLGCSHLHQNIRTVIQFIHRATQHNVQCRSLMEG